MGIIARVRELMGPIENVPDAGAMVRVDPTTMQVRAAGGPGGIFLPTWANNQPQWMRPHIETYDHHGYRTGALIFRCVQYVANATGSAPLRVFLEKDNQLDVQPDHPLRKLLASPNPQQGEAKFFSFVAMVMQVAGYALIEKERDRLGNVIALWPLRSDWARPIPRGGNPPDWEYRVPGVAEPFIIPADDVIVITYADTPDNRAVGIGPLEVALREWGVANALTDFLKAFLDRGAMPLYFAIPSDDPRTAEMWKNQATADTFRTKFRERYGGLNNATDIAIFGGIKDIKPLGFNFDELAYPQLRNLTDNAICAAFGVSPILVDAQGGLQNSTYNNKIEARRGFYEDFMLGFWGRIDDAITRGLLPEFESRPGYLVAFDVSDIPALKEDENQRWQRAMLALRSGGITVNDYRREIGMDPFADTGDVLLMPGGVTVTRIEDLGVPKEVPAALQGQTGDTTVDPNVDPNAPDPNADTTTDGKKSRKRATRDVPPLPDEVIISTSDVDAAEKDWDEKFPDFAGLLSATVEEPE